MALAFPHDGRALRERRHDVLDHQTAHREPGDAAVPSPGDTMGARRLGRESNRRERFARRSMLKLTGALVVRASANPYTQNATEQLTDRNRMPAFRFPVVAGTPAPTTLRSHQCDSGCDAATRSTVPFTASDASTHRFGDRERCDRQAGKHSARASTRAATLQFTLANSIVPQFVVAGASASMSDDWLLLSDECGVAPDHLERACACCKRPYKLKLDFDPSGDARRAAWRSCFRCSAATAVSGATIAQRRAIRSPARSPSTRCSSPARTASNGRSIGRSRDAASFTRRRCSPIPAVISWCRRCDLQGASAFRDALGARPERRSPRRTSLSDIVAQSKDFDSATQIRLARYLLQTPGWQSQGSGDGRPFAADALRDRALCRRERDLDAWGWLGSLVRRAVADAATAARAARVA